MVRGCDITHGQKAGIERSSRVHLGIFTACLRTTTSAAAGEPLCGPKQPTQATIEAEGAVRGENLVTGALTCGGPGQKFGTGCFVNGPQNSSITVKATINGPLPVNWSWKIDYDSGVAADQLFACPHNEEVCTATIKTSDKSQASGVIVTVKIYTPAGVTGPALGITLPVEGHANPRPQVEKR